MKVVVIDALRAAAERELDAHISRAFMGRPYENGICRGVLKLLELANSISIDLDDNAVTNGFIEQEAEHHKRVVRVRKVVKHRGSET